MHVIVTNQVNWHRRNLWSDREKNRENRGNLKMQFDWVPCMTLTLRSMDLIDTSIVIVTLMVLDMNNVCIYAL